MYECEAKKSLTGRVEMDDACIGGKRKQYSFSLPSCRDTHCVPLPRIARSLMLLCVMTLSVVCRPDAAIGASEPETIFVPQGSRMVVAGEDGGPDSNTSGSMAKYADSIVNNGTLEVTGGAGGSHTMSLLGGGGFGIYYWGDGGMVNNGVAAFKGGHGGEANSDGYRGATGGDSISAVVAREGSPFLNTGILTAIGGDGGAAIAGTGGEGGWGMEISRNLIANGSSNVTFVNEGEMTVSGGRGGPGTAVLAGGNGGLGLWLHGAFHNTGTLIAVGGLTTEGSNNGSGGTGLTSSGLFLNSASGVVTVTGGAYHPSGGTTSGGIGINVDSFENHGILNLLAGNGAPAVYAYASSRASVFTSGSVLGLDGGRFVTGSQSVIIEAGARVRSLGASGLAAGQSLTYDNFIDTTGYYGDMPGAAISGEFTPESTGALEWNLYKNADGTTYSAVVTRSFRPITPFPFTGNAGRYGALWKPG
jgi:hypothetical protein